MTDNTMAETNNNAPQSRATNWGPIVSAAISIIGFAAIWGSDQAKIDSLDRRNTEQDSAIQELNHELKDALTRQWDMKSAILEIGYRMGSVELALKGLTQQTKNNNSDSK